MRVKRSPRNSGVSLKPNNEMLLGLQRHGIKSSSEYLQWVFLVPDQLLSLDVDLKCSHFSPSNVCFVLYSNPSRHKIITVRHVLSTVLADKNNRSTGIQCGFCQSILTKRKSMNKLCFLCEFLIKCYVFENLDKYIYYKNSTPTRLFLPSFIKINCKVPKFISC